jgi:hypothetical protein
MLSHPIRSRKRIISFLPALPAVSLCGREIQSKLANWIGPPQSSRNAPPDQKGGGGAAFFLPGRQRLQQRYTTKPSVASPQEQDSSKIGRRNK